MRIQLSLALGLDLDRSGAVPGILTLRVDEDVSFSSEGRNVSSIVKRKTAKP